MLTLKDATHAAIREGWARHLDVPASFLSEPGVHVVPRDGARGVVVLELGDAVVAVAPPRPAESLRSLDRERLADIDEVVAAIGDPSARPIGSALLCFGDGRTLSTRHEESSPPDDETVAALLAEVPADECDESGVADMPMRWVLRFPDGSPAAMAGFEPWHDRIAQVGVVVHPSGRGRGLGRRVAAAAATAALDAALVPQWRCRVGNDASLRLAGRLGFVPLGRQLAVALYREPRR